jgi:uracil-DNA glycosylase
MSYKLKFKHELIFIDDSWTEFFDYQNEELRKIEALVGDNFTPIVQNIFKIFNISIDKIQFVIIGQDPYPQEGVATGRSFEIENDNWYKVNASLKTILSSIYYHSTSVYLDFESILEKIDSGKWQIQPPNSFFKNLESQKGVFFLNKSLTCIINDKNSHKEIWHNFTTSLIKYIDSKIECNWLLWGSEAWGLEENILKKNNILKAIHPAFWCYANDKEQLNRKVDFAKNSGLNLIFKTNSMKIFKKGDSEYLSNGFYKIEGEEFMSIWSYKKRNDISPNTNSINGDDGIELFNQGIMSFESKPDFGNFDKVLLYPKVDLDRFYN